MLAGAKSATLVARGWLRHMSIETPEDQNRNITQKLKPWLQKIAHAKDTAIVAISSREGRRLEITSVMAKRR